jgi:hypothetical protein
LRNPVHLVRLARVESLEPELADLCAAVGIEFDHDHVAAKFASDGCDEHADWTTTDHDDFVALLHVAAANVVNSHRGGFNKRGVIESQRGRKRDEHLGRNVPVALQRTGGVDANEVEVLADVLVSCQARRAGAIPVERHDGDGVTCLPACNAVTECRNRSTHLVAKHERRRHALIHVPVQDVQVGATQARIRDFDLHLAGFGRRGLSFANGNRAVSHVASCQH